MPTGDIFYAAERFGNAHWYLITGDGDLRSRWKKACHEARHDISMGGQTRPIDDVLAGRIRAFFDADSDVSRLSDEELNTAIWEFLDLARTVENSAEAQGRSFDERRRSEN